MFFQIKIKMYKMANKGYTTATDFADYLVKRKKLSFRNAYNIAIKNSKLCREKK